MPSSAPIVRTPLPPMPPTRMLYGSTAGATSGVRQVVEGTTRGRSAPDFREGSPRRASRSSGSNR